MQFSERDFNECLVAFGGSFRASWKQDGSGWRGSRSLQDAGGPVGQTSARQWPRSRGSMGVIMQPTADGQPALGNNAGCQAKSSHCLQGEGLVTGSRSYVDDSALGSCCQKWHAVWYSWI